MKRKEAVKTPVFAASSIAEVRVKWIVSSKTPVVQERVDARRRVKRKEAVKTPVVAASSSAEVRVKWIVSSKTPVVQKRYYIQLALMVVK